MSQPLRPPAHRLNWQLHFGEAPKWGSSPHFVLLDVEPSGKHGEHWGADDRSHVGSSGGGQPQRGRPAVCLMPACCCHTMPPPRA